jgi:hypothetical protein
MPLEISCSFRTYGLRELVRRAGVSVHEFDQFRIECTDNEMRLHLPNGAHVRFMNSSLAFIDKLSERIPKTVVMDALDGVLLSINPAVVRKVFVPFVEPPPRDTPLFRLQSPRDVVCQVDLPASVALTLSRYEELICDTHDKHGRFQARSSVAFRDGFLDRPVVDEYGLALERVLEALMPGWKPKPRQPQAMISHDMDVIGFPDTHRRILRHLIHEKNPKAGLHDLVSAFTQTLPCELLYAKELSTMTRSINLQSKVYFMTSPRSKRDSGYDIKHPKVGQLVRWLRENDVEIGFHPGYYTFDSPERLRTECDRFREAFGSDSFGGRQHFLRWKPSTWRHWEACGIAYDSTVGYSELPGFRAGTCYPYRPWLIGENRVSALLEVPLIVMDVTLLRVLKIKRQEMLETALIYAKRCREAGGVFSLLWHNSNLTDKTHRWLCQKLIAHLDGFVQYDWKHALQMDW